MEKVIWSLPTSVNVNGTEYEIRSDYRAVLDILTALVDSELDEQDKAEASLRIFYPDFEEMPASDYQEALNQFRNVDASYPQHHKNADALLKSGMCLSRLGDKAAAAEAYKQLLARFPNSEAAQIARSRGLAR